MEEYTKRLIGREDIIFDTSGKNVQDIYTNAAGDEYKVTRLNSGAIPVTAPVRSKFGKVYLDDVLLALNDKIEVNVPDSVLTTDTILAITPADTIDIIQGKIDNIEHNLGGHTLSIYFPVGIVQTLSAPLVFEKFFNGHLFIACESANDKTTVIDQLELECLFKVVNCTAFVHISRFDFVSDYTPYIIKAYRSPTVYVSHCNFSGSGTGVYFEASDGRIIECSFDSKLDAVRFESAMVDDIDSKNKETYFPVKGGVLTGNITISNSGKAGYIYGSDAASAMSFRARSSGADGAYLNVYGKDNVARPGGFTLAAVMPDGTVNALAGQDKVLSWLGNRIITVIKKGNTGTGWYRKYSDGWIEQGGIILQAGGETKINFFIPFANGGYIPMLTDGGGTTQFAQLKVQHRYPEYMVCYITPGGGTDTFYWYACGQGEDELKEDDESDNSTSQYDYDQLTSYGFAGVGFNGTPLEGYLNGTWTRVTTTDDATLQANGFKTEQWQLDGSTQVLKNSGGVWVVLSDDQGSSVTATMNDFDAPWLIPSGEWLGETAIPLGVNCGFIKSGN